MSSSRCRVAKVLDEGRRIIDVAESLGIGEGTLGDWVRSESIERGERAGLTRDDRAGAHAHSNDQSIACNVPLSPSSDASDC